MPEVETRFQCLRCGYDYSGMYDAKEPEERACPECGSNSVRPFPGSRRAAAKPKSKTGAAGKEAAS